MANASERTSINKSKAQLLIEGLAPYLMIGVVGYATADLAVLNLRDSMLPTKAPPQKPVKQQIGNRLNKGSFQTIVSRNIFNPDGTIPEPLSARADTKTGRPGQEAPPVPSQLPLNLVGTLVMTNPVKSIADIEVKAKNTVIAVSPNHDIDTLATLIKVERNKAIIRNLNNGRLEYIEIKAANKISFGGSALPLPPVNHVSEIKQLAPNKFKLSRETINKHTQDLSSLLMQASTIPRRKANGEIECYVLSSFQPNSIFADIGMSQGDCIMAVNGEPIDSPAKAMELYNALKTSNNIKITVESDGKKVEKDYTIE